MRLTVRVVECPGTELVYVAVAAAFADLPQQEQSILILCFVLDMADGEIGRVMGMSRTRCPLNATFQRNIFGLQQNPRKMTKTAR